MVSSETHLLNVLTDATPACRQGFSPIFSAYIREICENQICCLRKM